ncbi:MAG TPA: hypothetical protein VHA37_07120 [Candidatus Saccharimonadales bacterium]|nr:hypothetical protein [Candidatus Saccharimonadales bacterium]
MLDWCADAQRFEFDIPGMLSGPYSIEHDDITMFVSKKPERRAIPRRGLADDQR